MNRKSFLKGSVLTSGSIILAGANGVYAQGLENSPIDKNILNPGVHDVRPGQTKVLQPPACLRETKTEEQGTSDK